MWLSNQNPNDDAKRPTRRLVLLGIGALPLVGCGFEPALGTDGTLGTLRNRIRLDDPNDRNAFTLKSAFEDRIGSGSDFGLSYQITTKLRDIGITPERVITGQQIEGSVAFTLTDLSTGANLISDTVTGFTSFGTTGTTASTAFANEAAIDRLMIILAEQMIRRLALIQRIPT